MVGDSPFPATRFIGLRLCAHCSQKLGLNLPAALLGGRMGGGRVPDTGGPLRGGMAICCHGNGSNLGPRVCELSTLSVMDEGRRAGLSPATAARPQVWGRGAFLTQVTGRAWGRGRGEAGTLGSVLGAPGSLEDPGPSLSRCAKELCGRPHSLVPRTGSGGCDGTFHSCTHIPKPCRDRC